MSTRSRVGIENEDGTIVSVYVHSDGYPSGVGRILLTHYKASCAFKLMALGDLSVLWGPLDDLAEEGSREGGVVSYKRWRGEDVPAVTSANRLDFIKAADNYGCDYMYLYGPRGWEYAAVPYPVRQVTLAPLTAESTNGSHD